MNGLNSASEHLHVLLQNKIAIAANSENSTSNQPLITSNERPLRSKKFKKFNKRPGRLIEQIR